MASDRNNANIQRLIDDHLDAVYRYAYRLTGAVQDAEDLTQQVFLLAQERLDQLREADRARGWLFTILRHAFLKMVQRTQPVPATSIGLNLDAVPADSKNGQAVDSADLQAAIDELAAEFRVVVAMFYFEECSYREIAEKLDLPIGTVMSRLARAKGHLRSKLFETESVRARPTVAR
ncbi:MAG: sigma-70 family RNA polymerase sigma factor [Thermoguttaceae bacterium]|jgi:RNA polymerase sigma-70 factor (ECF subfamily)